jgi:hypothetical protein
MMLGYISKGLHCLAVLSVVDRAGVGARSEGLQEYTCNRISADGSVTAGISRESR